MTNQINVAKIWNKIKLNSTYRPRSMSNMFQMHDKNKAIKITEEGRKNLQSVQSLVKP